MSAAEELTGPAKTDETGDAKTGMHKWLKLLGLLGIMGGLAIAVVALTFDIIRGRKFDGGAMHFIGMLLGLCGAIGGLLLYSLGSFGSIEGRQRSLAGKLDQLIATGAPAQQGSAPTGTRPTPAPQRPLRQPAPQMHVQAQAPAEAVTADSEEEPAAEAPEPAGTEAPAKEQPAPAETEMQQPQQPAQPDLTVSIPEAQAQLAPTESTEPAPATTPEQPPAQQQYAYDYGTAATPGAQACPVCGNELKDGKCEHCDMSAKVQELYYEISKAQGLGVSITEASSMMESARQSMDEKAYDEAGEFVKSARQNLQDTTNTFNQLQRSLADAEGAKKKFEEEGRDTLALAKLLPSAKLALEEGRYPEAKELMGQVQAQVEALQKPPAPAPAPAPPELPRRAEISGCPKCGKKVMAGWKKCPYCLTPLS